MNEVSFFRQGRVDGGIRTGIDINGTTIWHHFEPGDRELEPVLAWFVDLVCQGSKKDLPDHKDKAKKWLLDQSSLIRRALTEFSDEIGLEFDPAAPDYERDFTDASGHIKMTAICAARNASSGRALSKILRSTGKNWESLLASLTPMEEVAVGE